ncbi:MAG TPA: RNA 2',3'-cyclic phosphodiesterase [Bdellovibrionales bacterium]|jgi:2'-5' RNA ligase|nr:RNA 2',3'-cyclic phosphodiesterase [Bdellovibrionales bacterium]
MEKRLFIGVPVIVGRSLESALKKTRITAQKREMEFEWTPSANFHITLSFIGATPEDRLPLLEELLTAIAARNPVAETSIRGMGAFPDEHHMRVLWVGVRKSRALSALNEDLRTTLVANGFPQDEKEFIPHLTIGRLRKSRSGKDLLSPYVRTQFGDLEFNEITLYESRMYSGRPHYEALGRFKLNPDLDLADESDV